jgi:predicted helicase
MVFDINKIVTVNWRPFAKAFFYAEKILNDVLTENHYQSFGQNLENENKVICITNHPQIPFIAHCTDGLVDAGYGSRATHNIPFQLYEYIKKTNKYKKTDNITDWGLEQFKIHYKNSTITKEDIFYYTYGVLHCPLFIKKYEVDLKRALPRIPYYTNFSKWVSDGKSLFNLHVTYEKQKTYNLKVVTDKKIKNPTVRLTVGKKTKEITIDTSTKIIDIPIEAWKYKLGKRTAIEWVLDQYKANSFNLKEEDEKVLSEKFNTYRFSDYKEECIEMIKRICYISLETKKITDNF